MSKRERLFLRDIFFFTISSFGGPQAHIALMLKNFVQKRQYLSEKELLEINALSQFLPGPSSTQTLVAIAHAFGGIRMAFLSLLIWVTPSMLLMSLAAICITFLEMNTAATHYFRYISPVAVGFVGFSAITLSRKIVNEDYMLGFVVLAVIATLLFPSAYLFPFALVIGGIASALIVRKDFEEEEVSFRIDWKKFFFPILILVVVAILGMLINRSSAISLPLRLFGNFYRNGFLIFGGGQVLIPLMYAEFVEMKHYLQSQEFLSAWAFQQVIPGPVFSFTSFIGGMSMRDYGIGGQVLGSIIAVLGINLPGFIMMIFVLPFWAKLKKLRMIKRALPGLNAVSVGFVVAAFLLMFQTLEMSLETSTSILLTIVCLYYSKIPPIFIILAGMLAGILL